MIKINKKFIRIYLVFLSFIIFEARGSFAADTDNYNSIEKCIQIGLKNNTGLLKAKYDLKSANESVKSYRALFEPAINLSGGRTDIDAVGYDIVKDGFSAGIKKQFYKTGGQLQLSSENEKTDTSSPLSSINPYYSSEVSLSYIQPLTENFFGKNIKTNMNQITIGKDISLMSFIYIKQQLVNTIKKAYAEYAYAHKNLRINKEKLDRAKKLFALNKQKFIDGLIEEVDLIATEAAVTINEAATMKAETAVEFSHDNLCYIVGVKPKDYNTEPSTKIYTVSINHTKAIAEDILKNALENRQDLKILKAQKQKIEMDYSINKNKKLPSVNLITRYGISAEGPDYNATYDSVLSGEKPFWYAGLNVDFFLFGQADRSRLKTTSNNLKKAELSIKDKITSIETECRDIARKLNTQNKYVAASMSAKNLQRKKLNLEEEKFNQGRSSIQWVLRYQDDLAAALSNYYRALTDYYNLKADLELYTGAYK